MPRACAAFPNTPKKPLKYPPAPPPPTVVLKASMGFKAVWLAYFLPLVVLLAVALGLIALGVGEVAAGLAGLGAVALYYLVLWLFRDRLRNEYIFTIQP